MIEEKKHLDPELRAKLTRHIQTGREECTSIVSADAELTDAQRAQLHRRVVGDAIMRAYSRADVLLLAAGVCPDVVTDLLVDRVRAVREAARIWWLDARDESVVDGVREALHQFTASVHTVDEAFTDEAAGSTICGVAAIWLRDLWLVADFLDEQKEG